VDLRPDEDMQLGREQIEHVVDLVLNVRHLVLVLVERVRIDDRDIDAAQIEQRIDIFRRPARDNRQDVHVVPVVDNPRHLRGKTDRRAFQKSRGKADRPGVDGLPRIWVGGSLLRLWRRTWLMQAKRARIRRLRPHQGRLEHREQRSHHGKQEQQAGYSQSTHQPTP
jgi:hypothetical protein